MPKETEKLRVKVEEQLERLVKQLEDLEQYKSELEPDEYQETRADTLEQMREFQSSLGKLAIGDLSLTDYFASIQLVIHAAITEVFRTPEIIMMFAKKQPEQLRVRLAEVQRDLKLNKISNQEALSKQIEIVGALKGLGEILSLDESKIYDMAQSSSLQQFIKVSENPDMKARLLEMAEERLSKS